MFKNNTNMMITPACTSNILKTVPGIVAIALGLGLAHTSGATEPVAEIAQGSVQGCTDAKISGFAALTEIPSDQGVKEVDVYLQVNGISSGRHGVHLHETANCTPCGDAGGHFDPGPESNTSPDGNHPYHSGDLVNINIGSDHTGVLTATTTRVTVSDGLLSLFDADGSAFIVHVNEDTFCPDGVVAGCAGGGRVACAIIAPPAIDESIEIAVSKSRYREPSSPLNRNTVHGNVYVFVSPEFPNTDFDRVDFYLDGRKVKTERYAPYDLNGTYNGKGTRLDTRNLDDGQHTVAVALVRDNGEKEYRAATFSVNNDGHYSYFSYYGSGRSHYRN